MVEYEQDSTIFLYATFRDRKGQLASISGTPQIAIIHQTTSESKIDVDYTAMSAVSGVASTYYYKHHIPAAADESTYTAIYSGTYVDTSKAVGTEDFLVIPRKFYTKKRGAPIARLTKDRVWTDEDKDKAFKLLEKILNKKVSLKSVENRVSKSIVSLNALSKVIRDNRIDQEDSHTEVVSRLSNLEGKEIPIFDDSNLLANIDGLGKDLSKLDSEMLNRRVSLLLASLEDLRIGLDDFKKTFVATLPTETVQEVLGNDANERTADNGTGE